MMVCKHCSTKNGIESRFCKSCGLELGDEDRDRARAELDKLVADGYSMLGQGRTEEAALVAEKVLEDNPDFAEALSLLGMCHERNLDRLAALECYERVVELRPDSALDRIKVQQMRNALTRDAKETPRPNRAVALAGAAAAVILVASIGGIVATMVARPASAEVVKNDPVADVAGAPFSNQQGGGQRVDPKTNVVPEGEAPITNPVQDPNRGFVNRQGPSNPGVLPNVGNTTVGNTTIGGQDPGVDDGNKPFDPGGIKIEPTVPVGKPDPNEPDGEGIRTGNNAEPPKEDPNQGIEINVHKPASNGGGGADANANEGGLTTLMKVAQDKFQLGKYGESAAAYEKALRMGGDPGRINQRLGQCYQHLNRTSDAIAAYSRAESALQSAVNGGRASAKAPLESVKQALQTLRGN